MSDYALPSIDAAAAIRQAAEGAAAFVDVRKPAAAAASGFSVRGALARDPLALSHDDPLTSDPRPLIVFCVHGHEVSQFACALLMLHGRDVRYVRGGFEALKVAGAPLDPAGEREGQ